MSVLNTYLSISMGRIIILRGFTDTFEVMLNLLENCHGFSTSVSTLILCFDKHLCPRKLVSQLQRHSIPSTYNDISKIPLTNIKQSISKVLAPS